MKLAIIQTICLKFGHFVLVTGLVSLLTPPTTTVMETHSRGSRGPASEVEVRPEVQLEISRKLNPSYNDTLFDQNSSDFKRMKAQVDQWRQQQEDSSNSHYRLENPQYFDPSGNQQQGRRQAITTFLINSNRDRYVDPMKDDLKEWWDIKRESGVIEGSGDVRFGGREKVQSENSGDKNVIDDTPFYKKFDLKIKPRVEKGRVYVDLKNPYFILESTITVQGKKELVFRKRFSKAGLEANMQHDFNNGQNTTNLDKSIAENLMLRASHQRSIAGSSSITDQRLQLMYGRAF